MRDVQLSTDSTTTIASSTTVPIARIRPNRVNMLIENPSGPKSAKVPTSETGIARSGIRVARRLPEEDEDDDQDEPERLEEGDHDLLDGGA